MSEIIKGAVHNYRGDLLEPAVLFKPRESLVEIRFICGDVTLANSLKIDESMTRRHIHSMIDNLFASIRSEVDRSFTLNPKRDQTQVNKPD